jgi:hypothetical protein
VEIELRDENGNAVPYQEYSVTLPDGEVVAGYLDENGFERLEFETAGTCAISFPRLDSRAWKYHSSTGAKPT